MIPILKLVFGIVLGSILSVCVIVLFQSGIAHLYPLNIANPTLYDYQQAITTTPTNAFLLQITGFIVGSFFGSYLAARISVQEYKLIGGCFVGFLLLLYCIMYFFSLIHPTWVWASTCLLVLVFSYFAAKIASK